MLSIVGQSDFHLPCLTVEETLMFHANLRLPNTFNQDEKSSRVSKVIRMLGLSDCESIWVGNDELKGISGGEKRRLSVAVQLLLDPAICLLDEPTTGLDAFTARHVTETLRSLSRTGRTVILSIHQPRYDVFALLDDVILLSRGQLVWSGSSSDMMKHLNALGHACPPLVNPADFILDISSIDVRAIVIFSCC